jgi:hemerythrin HHE cation binding domain-containing protein
MLADHERLDELLRSCASGATIERVPYEAFRGGLLRHIGIEEKILIPFARRRQPEVQALAKQLKLDHGAIAALLVPTPTPALVAQLRAVLTAHNPLEEGQGGLYAICARLAQEDGSEGALVSAIHDAPDVPLAAHFDGERAFASIERLLRAAGRVVPPGNE